MLRVPGEHLQLLMDVANDHFGTSRELIGGAETSREETTYRLNTAYAQLTHSLSTLKSVVLHRFSRKNGVMKRPAFQFYPADWRNNAKLRRCSEAARGAWMDVLCLLHDSEEYGVARFPLAEIARATGLKLKLLHELAEKKVLKGADRDAEPYIYTPRHGGRLGTPVTLVTPGSNPCWYCSRFVRDEWLRMSRGASTRFTSQPTTHPPDGLPPDSPPSRRDGTRQGDGASSPSSSTTPAFKTVSRGDSGTSSPVDNPAFRESTSTPKAAADSIAKAQAVITANREAAESAAPMPDWAKKFVKPKVAM